MQKKLLSCQGLHASPSLQSNASPKYNPLVLKFLDVAADVDFEIGLTNTQASPSNFVGDSLIYVDDEAISE